MELASEPQRDLCLDVDAAVAGSEARMINDYSGLASEPNVVAKVHHCPTTGELRIAIMTTRHVQAGVELLLDYGVGFIADWKLDAMNDDSFAAAEPDESNSGSGSELPPVASAGASDQPTLDSALTAG
jgi:hypothetical protein